MTPGSLPFPIFDGLSAVTSLELWSDGTIPAEYRARAIEHDRVHPLQLARVRAVRPRLKPAAIEAIIYTAIEKAALRGQALLRDDLKLLGLSETDINTHFPAASRRFAVSQPLLASSSEAA